MESPIRQHIVGLIRHAMTTKGGLIGDDGAVETCIGSRSGVSKGTRDHPYNTVFGLVEGGGEISLDAHNRASILPM